MVRHPFYRLVSFFQDRMVNHINYLGFIVATQKFHNQTENPGGKVTFKEFVDLLLYGNTYFVQ